MRKVEQALTLNNALSYFDHLAQPEWMQISIPCGGATAAGACGKSASWADAANSSRRYCAKHRFP
jgi:hypothetical protein